MFKLYFFLFYYPLYIVYSNTDTNLQWT